MAVVLGVRGAASHYSESGQTLVSPHTVGVTSSSPFSCVLLDFGLSEELFGTASPDISFYTPQPADAAHSPYTRESCGCALPVLAPVFWWLCLHGFSPISGLDVFIVVSFCFGLLQGLCEAGRSPCAS